MADKGGEQAHGGGEHDPSEGYVTPATIVNCHKSAPIQEQLVPAPCQRRRGLTIPYLTYVSIYREIQTYITTVSVTEEQLYGN